MKKQPEITDKTRKKFIDVFCELYTENPIEKITVQKVAKIAGYNRSTFYHYFSDMYELLEYVENDLLSYFANSSKEIEANTPQYIFQLFENKELYIKALLGKYGNMRFLERLKSAFSIDKTYAEELNDETLAPYIIEFHVSTSLSLFHLWLNRGKDLPPEKLFSLIHELYNSGIKSYL